MIDETLQLRLDQALATCRQRWWLGGAAVASTLLAVLAVAVGTMSVRGGLLMAGVATGLAIVSVVASGSHYGAVTIVFVGMTGVVVDDAVASPRSIVVAGCLYVFHALLAVMAATRHTSPVDHRLLVNWAIRSVGLLGATVAVWLGVVAFEHREWTGNAALTTIGLVVIAIGTFGVRRRILGAPTR